MNTRPFVGKSAFAHKGGIHVSAIMKVPKAYEHMEPALVGNQRRVLVSDLSGKSNVEYKAKELGVELGGNGYDSKKIVSEIKQLEQQGYQFDVAEGSFKILMEKFTDQFEPLFQLESFRVTIEKDKDGPCSSQATIKISVGDQLNVHIDGLDKAISGKVRWISHEPAFTPYYALNQDERARLMYLAEIQLSNEHKDLASGVPVQVDLP